MSTYNLSLLYSRSPLAPAAPAPGDRYVITLKAVLNESPCHHNMNCTVASANNFLGQSGIISRISLAQLAESVRKFNLNRPFICPILGAAESRQCLLLTIDCRSVLILVSHQWYIARECFARKSTCIEKRDFLSICIG